MSSAMNIKVGDSANGNKPAYSSASMKRDPCGKVEGPGALAFNLSLCVLHCSVGFSPSAIYCICPNIKKNIPRKKEVKHNVRN